MGKLQLLDQLMIKTMILGNHSSTYLSFHQFIASINEYFLQNLNPNDVEVITEIISKNSTFIKF